MARNTIKNFTTAIRYPFAKRFGFGGVPPEIGTGNVDHDFDNDVPLTWSDAADVTSIHGFSVDTDNRVRADRETQMGARLPVTLNLATGTTPATQAFFIADRAMVVTGASLNIGTLETATGTCTATITHDVAGQAPGAGTGLLATVWNCKSPSVANTTMAGALLAPDGAGNAAAALTLAAGDVLSISFGGTATITALAGIVLTVYFAPGYKESFAVYNMAANASIATQGFFLSNRDAVITGVNMVWSAAATNSGTVTADVTLETSTTAPGSGTSILAAAQSVKGAANTPVAVALSATAANLYLAAGNRLSLKMTGTLTALAGLVVVVYFKAAAVDQIGTYGFYGQVEANYNCKANGSIATQEFFIADRDYEIVDASMIWSTLASDATPPTADIQIDKGTTAPGSGTSATTGAVSVHTTANTTSVFALSTSRRNRLLSQGDRLSIVYVGTLTALAGMDVTVSLIGR